MSKKYQHLGYLASTIRFALLVLNFIFFIIGLILFITACILKWGTDFTKLIKIDGIQELINSSSISAVATLLLVLSGFIMVVSLIGFLGVKLMNPAFMLVYEVIVGLLFIMHGVSILVIVFGWSGLENEFRKDFTKVVDIINSNETLAQDFDTNCQLSFAISELFHCCGAQAATDFYNQTLVTENICCRIGNEKDKQGCNDKVIKSLHDITSNLLITPSVILLIIEVFELIMVPFLIKASKRRAGYQSY